MSGAGAAVGLVAGGLLTTYLSWRWVLFVNAPIGVLAAAAAPMVLAESPRRRGRFDLAGAITGTAGVALLVYGLSNASTDQYGVSHWGDNKVVASLVAAAVLLVGFVMIERRSRYALMPLRILADRSRSGAYLIMLVIATAMFGIFFFLSLFVQSVLGYSPVKSGMAFLPLAATIVVVLRHRQPGHRPYRRPTAHLDRHGVHQRRHVLVLPGRRAHHLPGRAAGPRPGHGHRPGLAVRAALAGRPVPGPR